MGISVGFRQFKQERRESLSHKDRDFFLFQKNPFQITPNAGGVAFGRLWEGLPTWNDGPRTTHLYQLDTLESSHTTLLLSLSTLLIHIFHRYRHVLGRM
jgi:hypothetical protein